MTTESSTPAPDQDHAAGTPDTTPTAAPPAGGALVRELERQLDELRQKLKDADGRALENLDRWQRAQADLSNFRRRSQFERDEMQKYGVAALVGALLPVLDSFDRAWQTLPGNLRRLTWLSGVDMINLQLRGTLERIGLTEVEAHGQPFDPNLHEAIDSEEHSGPPHVVAVMQAGYKLHERVLRPALVKVGPQPAQPPAPEAETQREAEPGDESGARGDASQ